MKKAETLRLQLAAYSSHCAVSDAVCVRDVGILRRINIVLDDTRRMLADLRGMACTSNQDASPYLMVVYAKPEDARLTMLTSHARHEVYMLYQSKFPVEQERRYMARLRNRREPGLLEMSAIILRNISALQIPIMYYIAL